MGKWKRPIAEMPRRELQRRAKKLGFHANQKSVVLIELLEAHERALSAPKTPVVAAGKRADAAEGGAEGGMGAGQAAAGGPAAGGAASVMVKKEGTAAAKAATGGASRSRAAALFTLREGEAATPPPVAPHSTLGQGAIVAASPDSDCCITESFTADEAAIRRARAAPSISLISPSPAKSQGAGANAGAAAEITSKFVPLMPTVEEAEPADKPDTDALFDKENDVAAGLFSTQTGIVRKEASEVLGGSVKQAPFDPKRRINAALARTKEARRQALAQRRGLNAGC